MTFSVLLLFAQLLPGAADTLVRVVDPQGLGIPGARVEVRSLNDKGPVSTIVTDERGEFALPFPPPVEIRTHVPGFDPAVRKLERLPAGGITVRLNPAALQTTVEVIVRDQTPVIAPSVGTAVEIDRSGARTVFDAVDKLVPGAFVTRRGVMGYGIATNGTGSVSIRGVGGQPNTGVLIVIDGRPDFQGLMGHPLPDFYSLSDAESVSVTQGPASVLYGSNAMGGVIEITPSTPTKGMETRLSTSLGSYMTGQHRLAHGASFGKGFYSVHAGIDHTRGEREGAAFRSKDASVAAGYDISPSWKASLQGRFGHFHVEDPGPVQAPLSNSYARVGRGGFSLNLDNTMSHTWGYARFYSSYGHHIITDGFRSVDNTTGGRVLQSFSVSPNLVVDAGTDVVTYGGRARNVLSGIDYGEHDINSAAGFTRVQYVPTEYLRVNTGLRYDHNSVYGGLVVPEFGATYRLSGNYAAGVAIARGFRNPTPRELYLFPAPNPLLKPERLWNYQATIQARPRTDLQTSVTAYYADLTNLIVTTGRFPNLELQNGGRALNRGLEATARWRLVRRLRLNTGYAYLRSTNLAPYIPEHKCNASIDIDAGRTYVHLGAMTVGRRWADSGRSKQLGGYTIATLKWTVPIRQNYRTFVMVDNLLGHRYEVIPGYPMPGANVLVGMTVEFR